MPQEQTLAPDFIGELRWRGLLHQATNEEALRAHVSDPAGSPRRAYAGFDPTADSLTIGNLVPIMLLVHFRHAGHEPVVLMGGGTGLIGDPSGKAGERSLLDEDAVRANVEAQRSIFEYVFSNAARMTGRPARAPEIRNNIDWLDKLGYIEVLRDIGKHFSVNMMIQKESVRERLNNREQGISYTEFSYMILQAYDFWHLFQNHKVDVQMGGSDQWGNIVAGCDLIRRMGFEITSDASFLTGERPPDAFGLTAPLVTKSDGGKFGKTESGAVWLSAHRTSPYAFYQFWLNSSDEDAARFLKFFTVMPREEVEALIAGHQSDPGARGAHRALARHMTELLHGPSERDHAEAAAKALFSGEIAHLPLATLNEVLAAAPTTTHDKSILAAAGVPLIDILAQTTLADSKGKARQLLAEGSISVNGHKAAPDARLSTATLLHGSIIALRRGKKSWHVTRWE